jgi:hypothetical protein
MRLVVVGSVGLALEKCVACTRDSPGPRELLQR